MRIRRRFLAASLGVALVWLCLVAVGFSEIRLHVERAIYGRNGRGDDVTLRVRSQIRDNRIDMQVNNDTMGGDPNHGTPKELKVVYDYGGKKFTKVVREGDRLRIP